MKKKQNDAVLGLQLILCLVPVVNIIFGLTLIIKSGRRKKESLVVGIFSVLIGLGYFMAYVSFLNSSPLVKGVDDRMAEHQLKELVKEIEYHKSLHGQYPRKLIELDLEGDAITIYETYSNRLTTDRKEFYYKLVNEGFVLFSSGSDGIDFTEDDVLPPFKAENRIGLQISEFHRTVVLPQKKR